MADHDYVYDHRCVRIVNDAAGAHMCGLGERDHRDSRSDKPSYHDLHITTATIPRTSIFNLPYGIEVSCNRVTGWQAWHRTESGSDVVLAGEYEGEGKGLRLDVGGHVIVDSLA